MDNSKFLKLISDYDKHAAMISQASEFDIFETPGEKLERKKYIEAEYGRWFEFILNMYAKSKCSWFQIWLANLIIKHKRIRVIAAWFRSSAKSVHLGLGIPLYLHLVKHDLNFMLLIGETETKANALLSAIQAQFQYNKRLINDYGNLFNHGDWADGNFLTSDNVRYMALGFMQNPRGVREGAERPDYIDIDDVDSKRHVNNDRMMREAVDFITEDIWGCFDTDENATERFVFANNNFHKNSITNRLSEYFKSVIAKQKEDKKAGIRRTESAIHYELSTLGAVKSLDTFEPNWPEKASAEYWREKFEGMPYRSFMREYMNVHIQDGSIFKYDDIQYREPLKLRDYDALCFYGDLSYKDKGDYKAMILVGMKGKEFHVILTYLRRKSRADCAVWLYDQYERYRMQGLNCRYYIEGLFAMDEFVGDFDEEGKKRGYYVPVVADKRPKADKFDRIESMAGHFERRNVFFNISNTTDQQTLVDQILGFEKGSNANDDGPDGMQGAISKLNQSNRRSISTYVVGESTNRHF